MHEHGLMKDLMRRIAEAAAGESGRVVGVSVWLGALSQMTASHFREHFADASIGTMAANATLDITVSDDIHHEHAAAVLLTGIELEAG